MSSCNTGNAAAAGGGHMAHDSNAHASHESKEHSRHAGEMDHAGKRDHAGEREHAGAREHGGAMGGMMDAERSGRHEGNMHGGNKASMKNHQEGCDIDDPKERARMNAEHGAM